MKIEKKSFRSGPFQQILAQGVLVEDTLHLSGQVSMDEAGNVVGSGDLGEQVRHTYGNVKNVLAEFGADMSNIVDESIYVTDVNNVLENLEMFCRVRDEAYGGTAEVSQTLVQVAGLVSPELMIEIKCVARL